MKMTKLNKEDFDFEFIDGINKDEVDEVYVNMEDDEGITGFKLIDGSYMIDSFRGIRVSSFEEICELLG